MNLIDLDQATRAWMLEELDHDVEAGTLYESKRFSERGVLDYPDLIRAAIESGDDGSLAESLNSVGRMKRSELRAGRPVAVPVTAAQTFAEGEFNRFYARGVCLRALHHGSNEVLVYRARASAHPREESTALVDTRLPALTLLDDLRTNPGVDPALNLPSGPNSGISVRCACETCLGTEA